MYSENEFNNLCSLIIDVNLPELTGKNEYIKDFIVGFNKMGFYTVTSQPGSIINNFTTFKTVYDRKYKIKKNIVSNTNDIYYRKQRAYIRGYMKTEMATFIINNLVDEEFIYARSNNHNGIINDKIKLGSVIFKNDVPIVYEISKEIDITKISDANESYDLSVPLHRPLNDKDDIVEFDIIDKRWNMNDYMWNKLYNLIKLYHQNNMINH